jgi:chemotaxis protein MotB
MSDVPDLWQDEKRENYYVSITDMLIGLLFLFIILLMYFALQLRETTEDLTTAEDTRSRLLQQVAGYLHDRNVRAEVDLDAGVLRLPDEILFEKGRDTPKSAGAAALKVLADALETHLPCYSFRAAVPRPATCTKDPHHVEAIFIEGHTDSDPINANARIRDNWDLSAVRASNTFRILTEYRPQLASFLSEPVTAQNSRPLMSIAGYADQRPVDRGPGEEAKARNRRIDVRFVMAGPEADELKAAKAPEK